ncbi:N-terminal nucleophile aminohydrolase [Trametes gibbosa]|nr:N-terminal nucleophile aminohydrolase [Trametes gibbosa]
MYKVQTGSSSRVVVVHGGAGFHPHSHTSESETKRTLRSACAKALDTSESRGTALQGVVNAITILEDQECLNAGYGSNLTFSGRVECDASIMDGPSNDFGAVGAVSGVMNPIQLAASVLQYSRTPDPLRRIPPLLLVSYGAEEFARVGGMICVPESLISPRAYREWEKWKNTLADAQQASLSKADSSESASHNLQPLCVDGLHDRQDTVGAIFLDEEGNLAAGVSRYLIRCTARLGYFNRRMCSGGLLLKLPGRVGEAAIYGAGCWATQHAACSVSGAGEYVTRMSLAKTTCEAVEAAGDEEDTHEVLQRVIGQQFRKLCLDREETSPQAGIILLVKEHDNDGQVRPRLWCAFTTESMAIGYASSSSSKPTATILRRRPGRGGAGEASSVYIAALPLDL